MRSPLKSEMMEPVNAPINTVNRYNLEVGLKNWTMS